MATIAVEYGDREEDALYLPCKDSELEKVLRATFPDGSNKITIKNVMWPEGLRVLNGLTVDVDELNFLAKSLDRYVDSEFDQFIAAASITKNVDMEKLINISFNLEHFTLVKDVSNLVKVGKDHYMNIHGGITQDELNSTNFAGVAKELLSSGRGIPTEYGLLFENEEAPIKTVYNGVNFPEYYCKAHFIAGVRLNYHGRSEYLYLPEEPITIDKAIDRLGCPNWMECAVRVECYENIDDNWASRMDESFEYEGLYTANHRASILSDPRLDKDKLLKVLEYSEEVSTEAIEKLAKCLDDFTVIDGAETAVDVAEYFMEHDDSYMVGEYARDFVDLQKMGEYLIEETHGQFIGHAFVCMEEGCSIEEIMGYGSPKMELGGM